MTATAEVTDLVVRPVSEPGELTIEQIVAQTMKVQQCIAAVMKDGEHYGVIPGTTQEGKPPKKVLLKPGAEKLCLLFRLDPEYDVVSSTETPSLIRFVIRCALTHITTGVRVASGLGSCNSNEDKYLRPADKRCPKCEKTAIKKSKFPPRDRPNDEPGWYCYGKIGGCGANFSANEKEITEQDNGIKDPADLHNTILKMACKRALIAAVLNATAASDFFTQDLEDLTEKAAEYVPPKDDLKEKLEASIAAQAPKAAEATEAKKFGKRFSKKATTAADATPTTTAETVPPSGPTTDQPRAAGDTGEAATPAQKDAIKGHMRKKAWKMPFVRLWFAELFGIPATTDDPFGALTQMQADAAHFLVLAHGTANYRKIRMEYADLGLVRRDENDVQF